MLYNVNACFHTSLLAVSEICLKLLTIALLLILSKISAFLAFYSISFYTFFIAFSSVCHKMVVSK